jgi:hypothetical protein
MVTTACLTKSFRASGTAMTGNEKNLPSADSAIAANLIDQIRQMVGIMPYRLDAAHWLLKQRVRRTMAGLLVAGQDDAADCGESRPCALDAQGMETLDVLNHLLNLAGASNVSRAVPQSGLETPSRTVRRGERGATS